MDHLVFLSFLSASAFPSSPSVDIISYLAEKVNAVAVYLFRTFVPDLCSGTADRPSADHGKPAVNYSHTVLDINFLF